jgi:hypothetical protein
MGQQSHVDKCGSTINAFSHWVVEDTAARMCFADLQGTECVVENGQRKEFVLFDPMTHTLEGYVWNCLTVQ